MPTPGQKLGIVTTWGTHCGLATYARYLIQSLDQQNSVILAEHPWSPVSKELQLDVPTTYCWSRNNADYSELYEQVKTQAIEVLFINCHYRFFCFPEFQKFLQSVRDLGVYVVVTLHQVYTHDQDLQTLITNSDKVVVHTKQNRLEVIANGAAADAVIVVPHGVVSLAKLDDDNRSELRSKYGISEVEKSIVCFGFVQPHKGIEGLLESIAYLRANGQQAKGYMVGTVPDDAPGGHAYRKDLEQYAQQLGVSDQIEFLDRFVTEQEVEHYLQLADLVLMNYQSQHYEVSGACSRALGAGAVVAASNAPAFECFGDAIWRITDSCPVTTSCEQLLTDKALRERLTANVQAYCESHSWEKIAERYQSVFNSGATKPKLDFNVDTKENIVDKQDANPGTSNKLRVLFKNRSNMLTQRGGDTIVIEQAITKLRERGIDAVLDLEGKELIAEYDIVHLCNFTLPEMLRQQAQAAIAAGVPYVVTTLNEDVASFHNQSHAIASQLVEYVDRSQAAGWYHANKIDLAQVPAAGSFDNTWVVQNAAALFTNGPSETAMLQRDYPGAKTVEARLAHDLPDKQAANLFSEKYGITDFILCVGRLESRKNQLQLLKALEHIDLPVVLAAGAFSYQREYAQAVRSFKRRGQTLIVDHLSSEMLASAYQAARIHVLPSWYELPGLVSLEAAHYDCNIVVSDTGTTKDYFGDSAWYCSPADEYSILHAVLAAYYSPINEELREIAASYTDWGRTADNYKRTYEAIIGQQSTQVSQASSGQETTQQDAQLHELIERGETAARNKEYNFAHELFDQGLAINPQSVRALRGKGAMYIAEANFTRAAEYMERAYEIDTQDPKTLSGLGMCKMSAGDVNDAYQLFVNALQIENAHLVTILQLIECAYKLDRYDDLIAVLRKYTHNHPQDYEMLYCLAGALYKNQAVGESEAILAIILQNKPDHLGAKQLKEAITAEQVEAAGEQAPTDTQVSMASQPLSNQLDVQKEQTPAFDTSFDSVDNRLVQLEEAKRLRKLDEAREGCEQLLSRQGLRPDQYERAKLISAELYILDGELDASTKIYDEVLEANPRCTRALCGKGALAANVEQWEAAFLLFTEAISYEANYDVALAGLGLCAIQGEEPEKAWDYFSRALESNPENLRALLGLIEVGYKTQRLPAVQKALEAYLDMHPADLDMVYSLAGCLFAQDRLDEARSELQKITLFEPDNERAIELLQIIDEQQSDRAANIS